MASFGAQGGRVVVCVEAACVDDADGVGHLSMTVNDPLILQMTQNDPLRNGVPGRQAYDALAEASADRFVIRCQDFSVLEASI